jgi:CheY-like chemotaxis protein
MAQVLALTADLLFGSRVQADLGAGGHEVELVGDGDALAGRLPRADVLVVDLTDERLHGAELVEGLDRGERPRTLGFYSHVDVATRERAERAGFDLVVPRSRMAREGAALVDRLTRADG